MCSLIFPGNNRCSRKFSEGADSDSGTIRVNEMKTQKSERQNFKTKEQKFR